MLGYPSQFGQVTLVGFSLGNQVIKSCIRELHRYGKHDLIDQLFLLGGAVSLRGSEYLIFKSVEKRVTHAYTTKDRILDLFKLSVGKNPIGQGPLEDDLSQRLTEQLGLDLRQFDVGEVSPGHTSY